MAAFNPRASVLQMFDPLQQPKQRGIQDKENSTPDDSMVAHFFKRSPHSTPPPVLRKRLIDIGDITMEDASLFINGDDDEDEEVHATPLAQRKLNTVPYNANTPSKQPLNHLGSSACRTPRASPLSVITLPTVQVTTPGKNNHIIPSIMESSELIVDVKQPWQSSSTEDLTTSLSELHLAQSTVAPLRRRESPLAVPRAVHDTRRDSVDLQSSFFMQTKHAESSFDLLKDEILLHDTDVSFGAEFENESSSSDKARQKAPPCKRASLALSKVSSPVTVVAKAPKAVEKVGAKKTSPSETKPTLPAISRLTGAMKSHTKSRSLVTEGTEKRALQRAPSSRLLAPARRATVSSQVAPTVTKAVPASTATLRRAPSISAVHSRSSSVTAPKPEPRKVPTTTTRITKVVADTAIKSSTSFTTKLQARASMATLRRAPSNVGIATIPRPPSRSAAPPLPAKTAPRSRSSTVTSTTTLKPRLS